MATRSKWPPMGPMNLGLPTNIPALHAGWLALLPQTTHQSASIRTVRCAWRCVARDPTHSARPQNPYRRTGTALCATTLGAQNGTIAHPGSCRAAQFLCTSIVIPQHFPNLKNPNFKKYVSSSSRNMLEIQCLRTKPRQPSTCQDLGLLRLVRTHRPQVTPKWPRKWPLPSELVRSNVFTTRTCWALLTQLRIL